MKRFLFLIVLIALITNVHATHILGGEIKYAHISGFTYTISVRFWTDLASPADRPEILVDLGGGSVDTVPRILIQDDQFGSNCGAIRYSEYRTIHTYPGPGTYIIRFSDQNRNGGIANVPNSLSQPFSVSVVLVISPLAGGNNSMQFTTAQTYSDWNWSTLVHDPGAIDLDGDSLSFELVTPEGIGGVPIAGYVFPDQYTAPGGYAWVDPATGVFQWHLPNTLGEFVIAIRASEWRNGMLVGQVTRDMMICISSIPTGIREPDEMEADVEVRTGSAQWTVMNSSDEPLRGELTDAQGRIVRSMRLLPGLTNIPWDGLASGAFVLTSTTSNGRRSMHRLIRP